MGRFSMARLTAEIWVSAYLAHLRLHDIAAFVVAKGDAKAGAELVKQNSLNGQASVFQRTYDVQSGARQWMVLSSGTEGEVDDIIKQQRSFDPDLWVIEVEDRAGRHLLDTPGLEA